MNYKQMDQRPKANPLTPFIGFVMILVIGGFSFLIAPAAARFLTETNYSLGAFGWKILPIVFPATWPDILVRVLISLGLFLFLFTILMIPVLGLMTEKEDPYLDPRNDPDYKKKKKRRR